MFKRSRSGLFGAWDLQTGGIDWIFPETHSCWVSSDLVTVKTSEWSLIGVGENRRCIGGVGIFLIETG